MPATTTSIDAREHALRNSHRPEGQARRVPDRSDSSDRLHRIELKSIQERSGRDCLQLFGHIENARRLPKSPDRPDGKPSPARPTAGAGKAMTFRLGRGRGTVSTNGSGTVRARQRTSPLVSTTRSILRRRQTLRPRSLGSALQLARWLASARLAASSKLRTSSGTVPRTARRVSETASALATVLDDLVGRKREAHGERALDTPAATCLVAGDTRLHFACAISSPPAPPDSSAACRHCGKLLFGHVVARLFLVPRADCRASANAVT